MSFFVKGILIFMAVWVLWYVTGGPLRDTSKKPLVGFDESGNVQYKDGNWK